MVWNKSGHPYSSLIPDIYSNVLLSPSQKCSPVCRHANPPVLIMRGYCVLGQPWQFPPAGRVRVRSGHDCELGGTAVLRTVTPPQSSVSACCLSISVKPLLTSRVRSNRHFSHLIDPSHQACKGKLTLAVSLLGNCETHNESFAKNVWRASRIVKGWVIDSVTFISALTSQDEI